MKRAWNLTREAVVYRHDAFSSGLRAAGFDVCRGEPQGAPGNLLLIWSRYGEYHARANRFEAAGGMVVVCENGYIGPGGQSPHQMQPRQVYALARGYHNDSTVIPKATPERWNALGVTLRPWRTAGNHILILPNRSFGVPERMMPSDWANHVRRRLLKLTKREVRLRPHPGNDAPRKPLADDLRDCWSAVIWSSSAGVHALVAGVPVICEAPYWIAKGAAYGGLRCVENDSPGVDIDRLPAMERLAHGQFSLAEIQDGTAFRAVLDFGSA